MSITLAEDNDAHLVETAHLMHSAHPVMVRQIAALLDNPETMQQIADHHSSLLVRMLAQRAIANQDRFDKLVAERNLAVAATHGKTKMEKK